MIMVYGIWYNDKCIDYTNEFYESELDSAITTDTPNLEENKLYTKEFGNNFYLFEKTDDSKYTKYMQMQIEGNEDIISYLEEAVKNGELTNIQNINEIVNEYRNRDTNSDGSNLSVKEQARENGQSGRFYREESELDIRSDSKASNENSNVKDNKGRTLTKEQQDYFKNSKVRDENGNLKSVYHGTDSEFVKGDGAF